MIDQLALTRARVKVAAVNQSAINAVKPITSEPTYKGVIGPAVQSSEDWLKDIDKKYLGGNVSDASKGWLGTLYHGGITPEPGKNIQGLDALRYQTGNILATYKPYQWLNRGLDKAFIRGPLQHTGDVFSRWGGSRAGKALTDTTVPRLLGKGIGGLARATGPWATPINAVLEGYDIAKNGYNEDEHRHNVTPDDTILNGMKVHPAVSYAGSAFNAWSNPIRSTAMLTKDVNEFTGNGSRPSLYQTFAKQGPQLDRQTDKTVMNSLEKLKNKMQLVGWSNLTPGEKQDLHNWNKRR